VKILKGDIYIYIYIYHMLTLKVKTSNLLAPLKTVTCSNILLKITFRKLWIGIQKKIACAIPIANMYTQ